MKNFRTLELAKELYAESRHLKLSQPIRDQFERAVLSIALNLAEGSAKPSTKDRHRFYHIALGSLRETQVILELIDQKELVKKADVLGAHLYKLVKTTQKS